tara:strand:- start:114 stop:791 length:678 start_codon:yes stop_codon:yes gene_type:complete
MASSYYKLDIQDRVLTRTKGSKALRGQGLIPGVLYYGGENNVNFSVKKTVLFHALQSGQRIFEIEQDGEMQYTMIKELQYHPVTDDVIHIDLMRVRRSEKLTIAVPLVLVGESIGVKEGGVLSQAMNQIEISCFPTDVPEQIELDINDLEMNSAKNVSDVVIDNEDIDIVSGKDLNIVSVHPPVADEEPVVEELEGEDAEESVEGDAPPSEEDGTEESGDDSEGP